MQSHRFFAPPRFQTLRRPLSGIASALLFAGTLVAFGADEVLPGTEPLTMTGDIASNLVAGVDRFLLREIDDSVKSRSNFWHRDFSSAAGYQTSISPNRARLAHILGVRDPRVPFSEPEIMATPTQPGLVAQSENVSVFAVRWPAVRQVHGEGLLLLPRHAAPVADVIAIPDATQTPEELASISAAPAGGVISFARQLAESGCRVVIPCILDRSLKPRRSDHGGGAPVLSTREFAYRPAFGLGRHLIGYELQKILGLVDWLEKRTPHRIGVVGWGDGGMLALYAAALDPRIDSTCVSGYFGDRRKIWEEPIDRNVFGLLEQFGDAELGAMIAPRSLLVDAAVGPKLTLPGQGGAPAGLVSPALKEVQDEFRRMTGLIAPLQPGLAFELNISRPDGQGPALDDAVLRQFFRMLAPGAPYRAAGATPPAQGSAAAHGDRAQRQLKEILADTTSVLEESGYVRREFMRNLQTNSLAAYESSAARYRDIFSREVIGRFDHPLLPAHPRSRKAYDTARWTGYEVVLDVFPDVIAYGVLLLPKDLKAGERRPVVVCQHGLEGRSQDTITGDHWAYHDFAAKLADRGFITFSPQNLYIFHDRFRTLQRKANPLKKTLFSIITPQHEQILNWLGTLPNVDASRIGFYGLSYGGKTAMRVPALLTNYALSICSADFNEWVWKNSSVTSPYSYVWTGEYEIFEFDLGSTFNYAEMAALISPRPFMVERGHFDTVAPDEMVAAEFAKVRYHYDTRLRLPERCQIEWFTGPHTINGKGTFQFLHKFLNWPEPAN